MVRLREISRTATFAWSPGSALPLIATGTRAGAVDADFSNETSLELWDLDLGNVEQGVELQPRASISTDSRFHDIAWGGVNDDHPRGIIAGALENGSLDLWDAEMLLDGAEDAFLSRTSKHSGAIKTLQFNPFRPELLATAGAKGELYITDLNNVANPFRLGNSAARADDFETLDWNKKVPHILATGSSGGFVTVWDVKSKKESLTLNHYGRKAVSAVAWDPNTFTKLITAVPNDTDPLILVWDLRNSNAPEKILRAHEQGVLSLSWCPQDSDLLLSCGKDNRTICWNPHTGQPFGEFPVVTNWTFQTRWNPHNPSLLATASFDGKIGVQTIQNTKPEVGQTSDGQPQSQSGEDFFAKAQTQSQGAAFSLPKPPKWLERPVGATFGFGGKVISFGLTDPEALQSRKSNVRISQFVVDSTLGKVTEAFEKSLQQGDYGSICQTRVAEAKTEEEKADWKVIETLISENPRKKLVDYLGFSEESDEAADGISKMSLDGANNETKSALRPPLNGGSRNNRLSSFFDSSADGDSFLSNLAATKGAKTNNPFHIYTGSESDSERRITRALLLGQFEKALEVCLQEGKMSDAFMIAICGGEKCIEMAQAAYFNKKSDGPNYLRLLASVTGKNLWDTVYNADLTNWREVMATLCTFADEKEFPDLCEALGDRLEDEMGSDDDSTVSRKDASFCYLAGAKLEKVVGIWIAEQEENERSGAQEPNADSTFSIHARALQDLIEKVTIFREVTKFQDADRQQSSGWKLGPLYEKYTEYADVVAAHGQLQIAEKYLDLLPTEYPAAEVARNRIKQASRKATQQPAPRQAAPANRTAQRPQAPAVGGPSTMQQPSVTTASAPGNPYAPVGGAQLSNPYGPGPGFQQPQQHRPQPAGIAPPPQTFGGYPPNQAAFGAPPRNINSSPSIPAPSKATNMTNWNDMPDGFFKAPTSRRATPAAGASAISTPLPNQQNYAPPHSPGQQFNAHQTSTPSLAPPPKGPAPPPRANSPYIGNAQQHNLQQPERSSSAAFNPYAPPPSSANQPRETGPPQPPRGPSPYNPPPSAAPPSNRYAPAPASQGAAPPNQLASSMQTPPMGGQRAGPPPSNPYAPQQNQYQQQGASNQYAPSPAPQQQSQYNQSPSQGPPQGYQQAPQGPPQGPPQAQQRPGTGQSQRSSSESAPATARHPPGDRSHIPANAEPIYEILNGDMQRVKSRAPTSFKAQVDNTEKRLNILFDHLNNEELLKQDTIESMVELAQALQARNYEHAQAIHLDILTNKTDECGNWMVGVKRLISMSKATP
ncbi:MAG: protein transport protein S31 [Candelina mexicana]|nr:MAG: protein transport protein S31 [Candelina mexicana]